MRKLTLFLSMIAAACLLLAGGGQTATAGPSIYNVNSFADSPSADLGDVACVSVAGGCTLRAAIQEANTHEGSQTIMLPAGTYTLTIAGTGENQAATGDLDITQDLVIEGAGASPAAAAVGGGGGGGTVIDGGGLDRVFHVVFPGMTVTLSDLTITGGVAPEGTGGGGIWNRGLLTLERVVVTANEVSLNSNSGHVGGGIENAQGELTVRDSTINQNKADRGGGIFNAGSSQVTLTSSTLSRNEARAGGGLTTYGETELTNVTVSGNVATNNFSGINVRGAPGADPFDVAITNSTIANNPGDRGDGLHVSSPNGTATVTNIILANNGGTNCETDEAQSGGHNIDSDGTCSLDGDGDISGFHARIAPLADNGGPTMTHELYTGSPAIDGGDDTACPAKDQRGVARPVDGDNTGGPVCDIGAVESDDPIPAETWGDSDCSQQVGAVDALFVVLAVSGMPTDTGECPEMGASIEIANASSHIWGDVDCSGEMAALDAVQILLYLSDLIGSQEEGCPEIESAVDIVK